PGPPALSNAICAPWIRLKAMRGLAATMVLAAALRAAAAPCSAVDDRAGKTVATAAAAGEYALHLTARSASRTSWGTAGNEAVILDVLDARGSVGHLVLHQ